MANAQNDPKPAQNPSQANQGAKGSTSPTGPNRSTPNTPTTPTTPTTTPKPEAKPGQDRGAPTGGAGRRDEKGSGGQPLEAPGRHGMETDPDRQKATGPGGQRLVDGDEADGDRGRPRGNQDVDNRKQSGKGADDASSMSDTKPK